MKEILSILPVDDDIMYVNWQYRDDAVVSSPHTNIVIAAYTTCLGRLRLYSHMEKIGKRLLYCDTDSCIFLSNTYDPNEYAPTLSSRLGDMTDDLESIGWHVHRYARRTRAEMLRFLRYHTVR